MFESNCNLPYPIGGESAGQVLKVEATLSGSFLQPLRLSPGFNVCKDPVPFFTRSSQRR